MCNCGYPDLEFTVILFAPSFSHYDATIISHYEAAIFHIDRQLQLLPTEVAGRTRFVQIVRHLRVFWKEIPCKHARRARYWAAVGCIRNPFRTSGFAGRRSLRSYRATCGVLNSNLRRNVCKSWRRNLLLPRMV
jgi:hypothetical protein